MGTEDLEGGSGELWRKSGTKRGTVANCTNISLDFKRSQAILPKVICNVAAHDHRGHFELWWLILAYSHLTDFRDSPNCSACIFNLLHSHILCLFSYACICHTFSFFGCYTCCSVCLGCPNTCIPKANAERTVRPTDIVHPSERWVDCFFEEMVTRILILYCMVP